MRKIKLIIEIAKSLNKGPVIKKEELMKIILMVDYRKSFSFVEFNLIKIKKL